MGEIRSFTPEKLVLGILMSRLDDLHQVKETMESHWGIIDSQTPAEEFTFSRYYAPEMGSPLFRLFCSFRPLIDPSSLGRVKILSNRLEEDFAVHGNRSVNLDPGILCQSKFILASTKNNAHRIPLGEGIYGELTLQYKKGAFRDLEWTYPDYREESVRSYLLDVRKIYVEQLKQPAD